VQDQIKQQKKKTIFLLKKIKNVILDADALTSFKKDLKTLYKLLDENKIITPHIKEFRTIFPKLNKFKSSNLKVINACKLVNCTIVLKGSTTYISNRKKIVVNNNSTKELAVIGSGDVLSGIIASLVGDNKLDSFEASCAGVWIHSEIGKKSGEIHVKFAFWSTKTSSYYLTKYFKPVSIFLNCSSGLLKFASVESLYFETGRESLHSRRHNKKN